MRLAFAFPSNQGQLMKSHVAYPRIAAAAAAGVTAALLLSGGAQAITDSVFKYSTVKTGWYSIPTAAMVPTTDTWAYSDSVFGSELSNSGGACFSAGVNLPEGATVTEIRAWYKSSTVNDARTFFLRTNLPSGATDSIVDQTSPDSTGTRKPVAYAVTANNVTNNGRYSYSFGTCANNSTTRFYGARITYTYTTAGD
jgi:hypothetical protein